MTTSSTLRERLSALGSLGARLKLGRSRHRDAKRPGTAGFGWRRIGMAPIELLMVPQDPRTADPVFSRELVHGQMGLAGTIVPLAGQSPFAVRPPSLAWLAELHSFGWLRHLQAAGTDADRALARRLVGDWLAGIRADAEAAKLARRPDVMGRRAMAWLSNANVLLDDADPAFYHAVMHGLADHLAALDRALRRGTTGTHRITAAAALTMASLALAGEEKRLARAQAVLLAELRRQILADGGHVSRSPSAVLAILLDLVPLRHCYHARKLPPPQALLDATQRMVTFIYHVRLGDGSIARFNGTGRVETDALATILAVDQRPGDAGPPFGPSGFLRLARGATTLIADCGPTPDGTQTPHAGCLSFEMTDGPERVVSNGGFPPNASPDVQALARAAASHSTLVLAATSADRVSATLCTCEGSNDDTAVASATPIVAETQHDGYLASRSLLHRRRLTLSGDGTRLEVEDRLAPPSGELRTARDLPFAIHIHLAPETRVACALNGQAVTLVLASGTTWQLAVEGARAHVEPGRDFAHLLGVIAARQIVLRGATNGALTVRWSLTRQPLADA